MYFRRPRPLCRIQNRGNLYHEFPDNWNGGWRHHSVCVGVDWSAGLPGIWHDKHVHTSCAGCLRIELHWFISLPVLCHCRNVIYILYMSFIHIGLHCTSTQIGQMNWREWRGNSTLLSLCIMCPAYWHYGLRWRLQYIDSALKRKAAFTPDTCSRIQVLLLLLMYSPSLWNNLPASFRQPPAYSSSEINITPSITSSLFHSRLKTHLFHKSFPP